MDGMEEDKEGLCNGSRIAGLVIYASTTRLFYPFHHFLINIFYFFKSKNRRGDRHTPQKFRKLFND
jgi:hypothetical protein